jgi:hypothetical protein
MRVYLASRRQLVTSIVAGLLATCQLSGAAFAQTDDPCAPPLTELFQKQFDEDCKKAGVVCDRAWNLRQTGILKAREILVAKGRAKSACEAGKGVVVAQIDTGVVDRQTTPNAPIDASKLHSHLTHRPATVVLTAKDGTPLPLSYEKGFDTTIACRSGELANNERRCALRDPDAEHAPRDGPKGFNPIGRMSGHGTRTMDVLLQAGPSLSVAPFKFANSILVLESRNLQLADAMLAAAFETRLPVGHEGRFDVVTMSLGRRSPSAELERAVLVAESRGLILVAAAGQFPYPTTRTRFPAAYSGVVSATGSQVDLKPWSKAGRGKLNTVAAPAFDVWRATWGSDFTEGFSLGNGTSFASPLVAATAAMWIQLHGRDALDKKYTRATVPAVFKYILNKYGHRQPKDICSQLLSGDPRYTNICAAAAPWDGDNWGRGILAADKVLEQDLPDRTEVCNYVLEERGFLAFQNACLGETQYEPTVAQLTTRVKIQKGKPFTYLFGTTLVGTRHRNQFSFSPSISASLIFAGHEHETPAGLMVQGQFARREIKLSIGRGWAAEYAPYSPKNQLQSFPIFGPTLGAAIKLSATYINRGDPDDLPQDDPGAAKHVFQFGPELQITFYRFRLQGGYAPISTDRGPDWKRVTWGLGFGF